MAFWLIAVLAASDAVVLQGKFKQAEQVYAEGRVHEALPLFDELLGEAELAPALRIEAQKYQAFALYLMQLYPEAKDSWQRLLRLSPGYKLDPIWVSPELHAFFGRIKPPDAPTADPGPAATPEPAPITVTPTKAVTPEPPAATVHVDQRVETPRGCGAVLCLVPFGVGQFANDRVGKGVLFGALEGVFLGANLWLYWQRANEFDRRGGLSDLKWQRDSLTVQRTTLVLFGATTLVGILDAYLFP